MIELPRDSGPVVQNGTRLATPVDKSALVEVTIDGVEYGSAMSNLVHGNTLRRRKLEEPKELLLDLTRPRLYQSTRVDAVARGVCVSGMGSNECSGIAVLVHGKEYAAGDHDAINAAPCPPRPITDRSALLLQQTTTGTESSGNKFPDPRSRFGLTKRLNRRFRKQIGGLLILGSEVRILPGALSRN